MNSVSLVIIESLFTREATGENGGYERGQVEQSFRLADASAPLSVRKEPPPHSCWSASGMESSMLRAITAARNHDAIISTSRRTALQVFTGGQLLSGTYPPKLVIFL